MLDYYGSIIKSEGDVDQELILKFREKCNESYLRKIISDLRREEVLQKEYSVSGWMVFHSRTIHDIMTKTINYQKQKNVKRLKFVYCYYHLSNDSDVCQLICDKL
jgi:hypothetical protein